MFRKQGKSRADGEAGRGMRRVPLWLYMVASPSLCLCVCVGSLTERVQRLGCRGAKNKGERDGLL